MDKFYGKVAKSLPNSVIAQLGLLFNASLNLGHFLSLWKPALVTMDPKKKGKDQCSPESYRSSVYVFQDFERIVLNRFLDIDTINDAVRNHQLSFRSRHSAIELVFFFLSTGF